MPNTTGLRDGHSVCLRSSDAEAHYLPTATIRSNSYGNILRDLDTIETLGPQLLGVCLRYCTIVDGLLLVRAVHEYVKSSEQSLWYDLVGI